MEILPRQLLLLGVCAIVMAMGFANAAQSETAPVVVGLAKCSDCTRKNMNAETVFKGLQVAVKCKNSKGEYETTATGNVGKSGAFSVPLAAGLVGEDGELNRECVAQLLHGASSAPCSGHEPSRIVAAPPHGNGRDGRAKTFVALAGKVHRSSSASRPECASAFLCYPFLHGHGHSLPPAATKPPVTTVPEHKPAPGAVPEYKPPVTAVPAAHGSPSTTTPVYKPPKPTPIYHPPAQRDAVVTDPQMFKDKKLLPLFKKKTCFFKFPFFPFAAQESKH